MIAKSRQAKPKPAEKRRSRSRDSPRRDRRDRRASPPGRSSRERGRRSRSRSRDRGRDAGEAAKRFKRSDAPAFPNRPDHRNRIPCRYGDACRTAMCKFNHDAQRPPAHATGGGGAFGGGGVFDPAPPPQAQPAPAFAGGEFSGGAFSGGGGAFGGGGVFAAPAAPGMPPGMMMGGMPPPPGSVPPPGLPPPGTMPPPPWNVQHFDEFGRPTPQWNGMPPPPGSMPPPPPPTEPDEDEVAPVPELSAASKRLRALLQLPVSRSLLGDDELYAKIEAARGRTFQAEEDFEAAEPEAEAEPEEGLPAEEDAGDDDDLYGGLEDDLYGGLGDDAAPDEDAADAQMDFVTPTFVAPTSHEPIVPALHQLESSLAEPRVPRPLSAALEAYRAQMIEACLAPLPLLRA